MKQINYKKLILPNIPYVFFVYLFDKVGQAVRLAPGADISAKILNITQGFSAAFENALPSVYPLDLLVGIVGAVIIRLIVYVKGKNAKKYRKGAVDMMTRMLAKELGPEVCVNAIGPTITYTPMMVGVLPADPQERAAKAANMPLKRIGEPEDCAGPAVFLASAASDFMSGQILYPDGGLTAMG